MSEIEEYTKKVKTLTYAQLVDEKRRWSAQMSQATGEYGYWGAVNGKEIVEDEMETRVGTEYKVLNKYVDDDGILREEGSIILEGQISSYMLDGLKLFGFIKEKSSGKSTEK